jgi:serine/threonine-protein kinase
VAIINEGKTMKLMRNILAVAALGLLVLGPAPRARADVDIDFDTYAAVAFSESTGSYGYAYNYGSRGAAERAALANCKETDAKVVGWVKAGWLALAVGDNKAYGVAWEYGEGAVNTTAKKRALKELADRNGKCTVLICVCSGNVEPEVIRK